ncbi:MAG: phosphodiesterase [Acidobacteria bacterium]|nr:MAG: phosphodiesterase [Acidobacteriota bacterium]
MSRRTLLLGLDGATFDVLDPLMADGVMPSLQKLTASGVRASLRSTVPALTPPAWTTLVTGRSPGAHGIFDFFRKNEPAGLHFSFLTANDVACPPIWSLASAAGLRSTILNFPVTFPSPDVRGHVIPGGFIPWRQLRLGCHPKGLFDRLRALPRFNPRELAHDMTHEAKAVEGCADEEYESWIDMHIRRERQWADIVRFLHDEAAAEFTAVLFDGTDKIQHLCWRFIDPAGAASLASPWERRVRDKCREYFSELDTLIGELAALFGRDTTIVIASDHGFGPQVRTFFINSWLERMGCLAWRDGAKPAADGPAGLGVRQLARHVYQLDWTRTRAFAPLPSGNGIHIVRADAAHPAGVRDDEYSAFRDRLAFELRQLRDPVTGEPVVARISMREDLFDGPYMALAPDVTLELQDGGLVSILASDEPVVRRPFIAGTHRPQGIFIATGPELRRGVRLDALSILDVAPFLLHSLDMPLSSSLEGQWITGAVEPEALSSRPPRYEDGIEPTASASGQSDFDAADEAEILRRLQALGYVE